jgi:TonB family protein
MTGRVIVITSGKGGVGKTTTNANIGTALARAGKKVVMIDTDLGLRNLDLLLGLENRIVYTIVDVVEQMPSFPGGQRALMDYIASNIRYPKSYNKVDQRIIVKFVVERDGSLSNITILKGSSEQALNDEALRVVRGMPKWIPGKQYGIERRVVYTVPVNFKKE